MLFGVPACGTRLVWGGFFCDHHQQQVDFWNDIDVELYALLREFHPQPVIITLFGVTVLRINRTKPRRRMLRRIHLALSDLQRKYHRG
jgi:hypothetical protein